MDLPFSVVRRDQLRDPESYDCGIKPISSWRPREDPSSLGWGGRPRLGLLFSDVHGGMPGSANIPVSLLLSPNACSFFQLPVAKTVVLFFVKKMPGEGTFVLVVNALRWESRVPGKGPRSLHLFARDHPLWFFCLNSLMMFTELTKLHMNQLILSVKSRGFSLFKNI